MPPLYVKIIINFVFIIKFVYLWILKKNKMKKIILLLMLATGLNISCTADDAETLRTASNNDELIVKLYEENYDSLGVAVITYPSGYNFSVYTKYREIKQLKLYRYVYFTDEGKQVWDTVKGDYTFANGRIDYKEPIKYKQGGWYGTGEMVFILGDSLK